VRTTYHVQVEPLHLVLWGLPTVACAFLLHGVQLLWLDFWIGWKVAKSDRDPRMVAGGSEA
jgi:uncharacterized membrane protein